MATQTAVIIGAGPAGLTAALELLERTELVPVVLEQGTQVGGLSRTVEHRGNRMDIGGHRFFTRSDRVLDWWLDKLPLQADVPPDQAIHYQRRSRTLAGSPAAAPDPERTDRVMLLRPRTSRILHGGELFDYPLQLTPDTLRKLGLRKSTRVGLSWLRRRLRPIAPEETLRDFMINRFGQELYETFFREYTEKVWGVPCTEISAEWGAQRIKGLDVGKAVAHFVKSALPGQAPADQTSLIEHFLYPKLGPGQLWELVAEEVRERGGTILTEHTAVGFEVQGRRLTAVQARDAAGSEHRFAADQVFSTMPVKGLVAGLSQATTVPEAVADVARGLRYRDFLIVGLLLDELSAPDGGTVLPDNWIYVQEPGVQVGRIEVFNNWSPFLVADPDTAWVGLEYFCQQGDALWSRSDAELGALAMDELHRLGLATPEALRDHLVIRAPKAYPAYTGTFARFEEVRDWLDGWTNLWPVGRNGMHRYNNQDHSMLAAMVAVDQLASGQLDRAALWAVNTDSTHHEERP